MNDTNTVSWGSARNPHTVAILVSLRREADYGQQVGMSLDTTLTYAPLAISASRISIHYRSQCTSARNWTGAGKARCWGRADSDSERSWLGSFSKLLQLQSSRAGGRGKAGKLSTSSLAHLAIY
jgi:hypothetical protein